MIVCEVFTTPICLNKVLISGIFWIGSLVGPEGQRLRMGNFGVNGCFFNQTEGTNRQSSFI